MNKLTFTVAICTYNRVNILKRCLSSLAKADSAGTTFEILVIDNNSTDCTKEISTTFAARFLHFRYYFEQQQGLSYARNAAYQLAKGEWLVYLDDDAKVFEDFFLQLQLALSNFPFPCFGGWYSEYYLHERPKWLPIGFGTMTLPRPDSGELKTEIIHGGIMIIKKSLLEELNGFDTKLGMKGKYIGYAEEEEIQV
ncbi:MAG: glycosyltransferase family 2 protein, partial [Saprospiraceae bacterium]